MKRLWIKAANEAEYEEIEEWILYKLGPLGLLGDELPTVIQTADRLHVKELSPAYGVIGEALPLMIEHFGAENLMVKEFPIEPPQDVNGSRTAWELSQCPGCTVRLWLLPEQLTPADSTGRALLPELPATGGLLHNKKKENTDNLKREHLHIKHTPRREKMQMIEKPTSVNDMMARNIDALNEVFEHTQLSKSEERSLLWLAAGEPGTVINLVSAIKKIRKAVPV